MSTSGTAAGGRPFPADPRSLSGQKETLGVQARTTRTRPLRWSCSRRANISQREKYRMRSVKVPSVYMLLCVLNIYLASFSTRPCAIARG